MHLEVQTKFDKSPLDLTKDPSSITHELLREVFDYWSEKFSNLLNVNISSVHELDAWLKEWSNIEDRYYAEVYELVELIQSDSRDDLSTFMMEETDNVQSQISTISEKFLCEVDKFPEEANRYQRLVGIHEATISPLSVNDSHFDRKISFETSSITEVEQYLHKVFTLREEQAKKVGFDNYAEYFFSERSLFPRSFSEFDNLCKQARSKFYPLAKVALEAEAKEQGVTKLDSYHGFESSSFQSVVFSDNNIDSSLSAFDPRFSSLFKRMKDMGCFHIVDSEDAFTKAFAVDSSKGELAELFIDRYSYQRNLEVTFHELTHAYQISFPNSEYYWLNSPGEDIEEILAVSIDTISLCHIADAIEDRELAESVLRHKVRSLAINIYEIIEVATLGFNAFQMTPDKALSAMLGHEFYSNIHLSDSWAAFVDTANIDLEAIYFEAFESDSFYLPYLVGSLVGLILYDEYLSNPNDVRTKLFKALDISGSMSDSEILKILGVSFEEPKELVERASDILTKMLNN